MSDALEKRETLLCLLRNPTGDWQADHSDAEKALVEWLQEVEPDIAEAWEKASRDWWYA